VQFDSPQDDLSLWKIGAESYIMARGSGGVMGKRLSRGNVAYS
jgi:hypothetical protein